MSYSIGETINLLKEEFPDVTVSKVRFLESQGLIEPPRTPSGYREFGSNEIERLRYILRQQRDHFLPLKVIKSKLTAWERGEDPKVEQPEGVPPETYFAGTDATFDSKALARAAGVQHSLVADLEKVGVIDPTNGPYGEDELAIVRNADRLIELGLEPRHLRAFRLAGNRETDLFAQLAGPLLRHKSPDNRRQAAAILSDCAQAARDLQDAIVRSQLRDLLRP